MVAVYTWGVLPEHTLSYIGTSTAEPSAKFETDMGAQIRAAASAANVLVNQFAGVDPSTLDSSATQVAASAAEFIREYVRTRAAATWVRPRNLALGDSLVEDAARLLEDLRYRLPEARSALAPSIDGDANDRRLQAQVTPPPTWLDVPEGEAFG